MKVFKGIHLQKHLQNGNQEIMKVTKTQNLSSKKWSRRRGSNPRHPAWKAGALATCIDDRLVEKKP